MEKDKIGKGDSVGRLREMLQFQSGQRSPHQEGDI